VCVCVCVCVRACAFIILSITASLRPDGLLHFFPSVRREHV
jgi:hypothetical protein